jgi:UDP-N-acetylglucosamine--N-acetylmuramyl-(pentapeptide) pyrophosphoryl-undecaprenol N-acetylglucosamine transferase
MEIMKDFSSKREDVMHFHASGSRGYENAKVLFAGYGLERNERLMMSNYIYDMPTYMAAADVVICRAGAMTLSEIAMMKKAAIFIPSPNVVDNHQYKNAKLLADKNAAMVVEEKDLTVEGLTALVSKLLSDDELRENMSKNVGKFARSDANKLIYDEVINLVSSYTKKKK